MRGSLRVPPARYRDAGQRSGGPTASAGRGRRSTAARGMTSRPSCAKSACARPGGASRSAGSCSPRATGASPRKCCTRKRTAPKCRCARHRRHAAAVQAEVGLLRRSPSTSSKAYFDTNNTEHHHFFIEDKNDLLDIPSSNVVVGKAPVPPEGYPERPHRRGGQASPETLARRLPVPTVAAIAFRWLVRPLVPAKAGTQSIAQAFRFPLARE